MLEQFVQERGHKIASDYRENISGTKLDRSELGRLLMDTHCNGILLVELHGLLDEATSHLDVESEIQINQMLRQLGLPVLLIAHRPETIASADRVLYLADGYFTELKHQRTVDGDDLVCNLTDELQVKNQP